MLSSIRRSRIASGRRRLLRWRAGAWAAADGFTLIEALVAVAVLAVVLAGIGSVVGTIVKGARSAQTKLPLLETAQALMATLPGRDALEPGTQTGVRAGYRWRLDIKPLTPPPAAEPSIFTAPGAAKTAPRWMLFDIALRVQGPEGPPVRLETVRLAPARIPQ